MFNAGWFMHWPTYQKVISDKNRPWPKCYISWWYVTAILLLWETYMRDLCVTQCPTLSTSAWESRHPNFQETKSTFVSFGCRERIFPTCPPPAFPLYQSKSIIREVPLVCKLSANRPMIEDVYQFCTQPDIDLPVTTKYYYYFDPSEVFACNKWHM